MGAMGTVREELRQSWEQQQAIHEPDREQRFQVMLDHVEQLAGPPDQVLDLACGPGSITRRVLDRFPAAQVVAVDVDPLLLDLARDAFAGDRRVRVLRRQLADPNWTDGLTDVADGVESDDPRSGVVEADGMGSSAGAGRRFDAVLTATAMHWLPAPVLAQVYAGVARVLRPGGVFANADHIPIAEPVLRAAAAVLHKRHLRDAFAAGAESCDQWYERAYGAAPYEGWWAERERMFAHWTGDLLEREGWHVDLLRRSGFERAGTVWRHGNDALLLALRS